ncbi:hypothetical protein Gorai_009243, partial [Gossypium raimondii]|nr:hypothetical protein [Gossypium raimondii]
ELSQLDAKLDAKLKATFKEFKDEFKGELRSELHSLFGQYLGYQNLSMRNTKTLVRESMDKDIANHKPIKPSSIESTPFQLGKEVKDLDLATTLRNVDNFAVDLEHNQYQSSQGLTFLMQISTKTKDFIVDTLKLRIHIGPYFQEVFKDSMKKEAMHRTDWDILWIQRDFNIHLCNLLDIRKASKVLKLEQNRYARKDTRYLLHIYDFMRIKLLPVPKDLVHFVAILVDVYKKSSDIRIELLPKWGSTAIRAQEVHSNGPVLNDSLLVDLEVSHAIENEKEMEGWRALCCISLAQAMVKGTDDHCCEYMIGGSMVILGKVERNVVVRMTGGLAYILDENDTIIPKVNKENLKIQRVADTISRA